MNTQDKIVKNRLGILNLAKTLGNVSKACKVMGRIARFVLSV